MRFAVRSRITKRFSEFSVFMGHLVGNFRDNIPVLYDLAIVDTEQTEECGRRTAERALRHCEDKIPFRNHLVNGGVFHRYALRRHRFKCCA